MKLKDADIKVLVRQNYATIVEDLVTPTCGNL